MSPRGSPAARKDEPPSEGLAMSWDPDTYPQTIRAEIHDYDELQHQVAWATTDIKATDILDLGIGAGETAHRVLDLHPQSHLVGIDSSSQMLRGAAKVLPAGRVTLLEQDLAAPLPDRDFDLVISALAIHHLQGKKKAELFTEVARHLRPGGLFVFGDVVVPLHVEDVVIENDDGYDFPSSVEEQVAWLTEAGFSARVVWVAQDLVVLKAQFTRG